MTIPEVLEAIAWTVGGDTGTSSETIWGVMTGIEPPGRWHGDTPCDAADFGRCYRLLQRFPAWRKRLPEVAERWPAWRPLVADWDEVTALYEKEPSPYNQAVSKRLREINDRQRGGQ
jgi:hypothetical protein